MVPQQYCLRWKHHHSNVQSMFAHLLEKERFCDVTLYCSPSFSAQVPNKDIIDPQTIKGVSLRAHRVVLAACSELLGSLLGAHESLGEPVLVIDGAEPCHLKALLDYMYTGEMNVHHSQLANLLKTAEELRIKGLTDIRWNNKDEPPDSQQGLVTTVTPDVRTESQKPSPVPKRDSKSQNLSETTETQDVCVKEEDSDHERDRHSVNGGPPPLIKLQTKDRFLIKRESSEPDSPSPKRQRVMSMNDHVDEESRGSLTKSEKDNEWQHGNLDISAERVIGWPEPDNEQDNWSGEVSDDDWADAPTDIGSFLHTNLRVDGDNSAAEEDSVESSPAAPAASSSSSSTAHIDLPPPSSGKSCSKSGPSDPRFGDVVKLNDYLQHGRRPQFWEENYVKRIMESVRVKELEMKQAAEILGVSYGTLYGRYRDVYGCINRPYRTARDFWQAKGPSEVLERLQRGELSLDAACLALGVSHNNLSAFLADTDKEFEPIPIEIDPSLRKRASTYLASNALAKSAAKLQKRTSFVKDVKSVTVGSLTDDDSIPATVITTHDKAIIQDTTTTSGTWPTIRIANIESLLSSPPTPSISPSTPITPTPTSPSHIMRSRPDLTIIAAKKPEAENGT